LKTAEATGPHPLPRMASRGATRNPLPTPIEDEFTL